MPLVLKRGGGYGEFCLRTDAKPSGQAGNRRAKQADSEGESEGEGEGDRHGAIMKMNANGGEGSQGRSVGKGSKMMRSRPTKASLVLLKEQLGLLQHQETPLWAQKELRVKYLSAVHKLYIILSMKIYKYILMSIKHVVETHKMVVFDLCVTLERRWYPHFLFPVQVRDPILIWSDGSAT